MSMPFKKKVFHKCHKRKHKHKRYKVKRFTSDPGGIICLTQAANETRAWREKYAPELGGIKGFFIPMNDLACLVNDYCEYGATGARAYLGYVPDGIQPQTADGLNSKLRLILVPANEEEDFYNKGAGNDSTNPNKTNGSSSAYDFTMPCPSSCAADNPLNSNVALKGKELLCDDGTL
jgi:hypothetical protein